MTRVLIADDQTLVREGFALLLARMPDMEILPPVADGYEAVDAAAALHPDVVLMDLRMPQLDGVEATRRIHLHDPGIAVLILTTYLDDATVLPALRAGARGVIGKDATPEQVRDAIATVHTGRPFLPTSTQTALLGDAQGEPPRVQGALSPREVEVLRLLSEGERNEQIATILGISIVTVKTHVNNIFTKTGARRRREAIAFAAAHGLLDHPTGASEPEHLDDRTKST